MVQDVPNLRAHVESRAQRPLWIVIVIVTLTMGVLYLFSGPGNLFVEPVRRSSMIDAAELFADGHFDDAIAHLSSNELSDTPEGAFLRAVIYYYGHFDEKPDAVRAWLTDAADAGIPGADTMLGWVLLPDPNCASCIKQAAQWFEHALAGRADRSARLGLAATLTQLTRELSLPRAHYDALLAEDTEDTVRLQALTLRGSVEPNTVAAIAYAEAAAQQGFAEAQFRLWKRYLPGGDAKARLWLEMAALQGHEEAVTWVATSPDLAMTETAARRLLAMAEDPHTAIGRAARWCDSRASKDDDWLRHCRLTALEAHLACTLPASVIDTLGLRDFEGTEAYSNCRLNLLP
jgi:TPR repeat protein